MPYGLTVPFNVAEPGVTFVAAVVVTTGERGSRVVNLHAAEYELFPYWFHALTRQK
jgi:hypothetical protein